MWILIWSALGYCLYFFFFLFCLLCFQNSQCMSVPNSTTHELTGASVRDVTFLRGPVLMSSVQQGFQELNPEQSERLRSDLNTIKSSYHRNPVSKRPNNDKILICCLMLLWMLCVSRKTSFWDRQAPLNLPSWYVSLTSCQHWLTLEPLSVGRTGGGIVICK